MTEIRDRVRAHRERAEASGLKRIELTLPETVVTAVDGMAQQQGVKRGELLAKLVTEAVTGNKVGSYWKQANSLPETFIDPLSGKPPRDEAHRQKLQIWRDMALKLRDQGYSIRRICDALGDLTSWDWTPKQTRQLIGELPETSKPVTGNRYHEGGG